MALQDQIDAMNAATVAQENLTLAVAAYQTALEALTKNDVGLGNVENYSSANMPFSDLVKDLMRTKIYIAVDSIAALRALDKTKFTRVLVTSYYANVEGGGGEYILYQTTNGSANNDDGINIGATDGGWWRRVNRGPISFKVFGVIGGAGGSDDTAAIAKVFAYARVQTKQPEFCIEQGIYTYSVSPNMAIQNLNIVTYGDVRFNYTGTGHAIIIDADAAGSVCVSPGYCYNVSIGRIVVEGRAGSKNGVFMNAISHSRIGFKVRGSGQGLDPSSVHYAAYHLQFVVACTFPDCTVSTNEESFVSGATPYYGIFATRRGSNELTGYNIFTNFLAEGVVVGMYFDWTIGNIFIGGISEGNTSIGVVLSENSFGNRFYGFNCQQNTDADFIISGTGNELVGCSSDTYTLTTSTAKTNKFLGGAYVEFAITSGAQDTLVSGFTYNRFSASAGFTDAGTRTRCRDLYNAGTHLWHNTPLSYVSQVYGSSGSVYTNVTGGDVTVYIYPAAGSTISYIGHNRLGTGDGIGLPVDQIRQILLSPNDSILINFTGDPPTLKILSR